MPCTFRLRFSEYVAKLSILNSKDHATIFSLLKGVLMLLLSVSLQRSADKGQTVKMADVVHSLSHTKEELSPHAPRTNITDYGAPWIKTTMENGLTAVST